MGHVATVVIAALRHRTFASLAELTAAIQERITGYNAQAFQKRPGSRHSVFQEEEKHLLRPLPGVAYEISTWARRRRVARNGHVTWAKNHYSVPYMHVGEHVDLRITAQLLEVWQHDRRLASHVLLPATALNQYATREADLPEGKAWREWDRERVSDWARRIGPQTAQVVERMFESVPVDDQAINPALAVLRLSRRFSPSRLETAAGLGLASGIYSPRYGHLHPILATSRDKAGTAQVAEPDNEPTGYVRGAAYYAGGEK